MATIARGTTVKFRYGPREGLNNLNKILQKVEMYLDESDGTFYVIPVEEESIDLLSKNEIEIGEGVSLTIQ